MMIAKAKIIDDNNCGWDFDIYGGVVNLSPDDNNRQEILPVRGVKTDEDGYWVKNFWDAVSTLVHAGYINEPY